MRNEKIKKEDWRLSVTLQRLRERGEWGGGGGGGHHNKVIVAVCRAIRPGSHIQ